MPLISGSKFGENPCRGLVCGDAMSHCLDKKEAPCATKRMQCTRKVLLVETQNIFFGNLAGLGQDLPQTWCPEIKYVMSALEDKRDGNYSL